MKKPDTILREYVRQLSDDSLKYIHCRLKDRIGADVAEALDRMATAADVDKWLATAKDCEEFYDMLDLVRDYADKELYRREPEDDR